MTGWTGAVVALLETGIFYASSAVEARLFLLAEVDCNIASFTGISALTFALPATRMIDAGTKGTTGTVEALVDVLLAGLSFPAIQAGAYREAVFGRVTVADSTRVNESWTVVVAFVRQVTACSRFARRTFASIFSQFVDADTSFGTVIYTAVVVVDFAVCAAEAVNTEAIVAAPGILARGTVFASTAHGRGALVHVELAEFAHPASSTAAGVPARLVLANAAIVALVVSAVVDVLGTVRPFETDVALADGRPVRALLARAVYAFRRVAGLGFRHFTVISTPARRAHAIVTFSVHIAASTVLAWSQVAGVVRSADGGATLRSADLVLSTRRRSAVVDSLAAITFVAVLALAGVVFQRVRRAPSIRATGIVAGRSAAADLYLAGIAAPADLALTMSFWLLGFDGIVLGHVHAALAVARARF